MQRHIPSPARCGNALSYMTMTGQGGRMPIPAPVVIHIADQAFDIRHPNLRACHNFLNIRGGTA
jgi:hypothetical protein